MYVFTAERGKAVVAVIFVERVSCVSQCCWLALQMFVKNYSSMDKRLLFFFLPQCERAFFRVPC